MSVSPREVRRLVLVDGDAHHARRFARVLRATQHEVEVHAGAEDLGDTSACDLLVVNYPSLGEGARDTLLARFPRRSCRRLLASSSQISKSEFSYLLTQHGLTNLIADDDAEDDHLLITVQKILRGDVFGLDKYFPWGSESSSVTMYCSSERCTALSLVEAFAAKLRLPARLTDAVTTATDELLTNAFYDAPTDDLGGRPFAALPRSTPVRLAGAPIAFELRTDGRRLGVAVRDPFGSLRVDEIIEYLARSFAHGPAQVQAKPGGAGLGLYYVFESSSHMVINIGPGRCTEMIGIIDIRGSYRDFASKGKSFNVFVADEA